MLKEQKENLNILLKENKKWDWAISKAIANVTLKDTSSYTYKHALKETLKRKESKGYSRMMYEELIASQLNINASLSYKSLITMNRALLIYMPTAEVYHTLAHELGHAIDTRSHHKKRFKKTVQCLEKKYQLATTIGSTKQDPLE